MATISAAPASLVRPRPRVRASVLTLEIVLTAAVLLGSTVFLGRLVGAVIAEPAAPVAAPVSVSTSGTLSVAGLAGGGTTVSTLTVTNTGTGPVRWSVRPTTTGTPGVADQLAVRVVSPVGGACSAGGTEVAMGAESATPLAPGASTPLCVVLEMPAGAGAGSVTPGVSVTAVPA